MKQTIALIPVFAALLSLIAGTATPEQAGSLFISPEYAAAQMKSSRDLLLVDVRKKAAFEQVRIPGAIHVPVHFVKTKAYLKNKKIVLVNKGFSRQPLVSACKDLNEKGFDARILSGGLNTWAGKGLPVTGSPFAKSSLAMVSPRMAFQEHADRNFLPVDISGSKSPAVFDNTVHVNPSNSEFLNVAAGYHKNHPHGSVLIFSQAGTGYETFRKQLKSADIKNVFFLTGGMKAYNNYLENRKRAGAPKTERIKSTNQIPCRSCED